MTTYLLINTAGSQVLREEQFDTPPPTLAAAKGVRWISKADAGTELAPACLAGLLASEQDALRTAINARRDECEAAGFDYMGKRFDCNSRSVQRINTAVQAAQAAMVLSQPYSVDWTCADNSTVTLDAAGVLGMVAALALRGNAVHQHARSLKVQVDAATTLAELTAIDITTGWPV